MNIQEKTTTTVTKDFFLSEYVPTVQNLETNFLYTIISLFIEYTEGLRAAQSMKVLPKEQQGRVAAIIGLIC